MTQKGKTIGIGAAEDADRVIASACRVDLLCDIACYCRPGAVRVPAGHANITLRESCEPEKALVSDLMDGTIGAAVRGTLPANTTLAALKKGAGVDHLERIALLETADGKKFLFGPVGIDEGWTVADKLALVAKGRAIAKKFGLPEKAGILSGGRLGDLGRHPVVDRTMADAELVAKLGDAVHYEILIEDAVKTCGIIIAPDGISGNLVFRTLAFLGAGHGHGAPVVNLDKIFVDTSRAQKDYANALMLAAALLE
ncbi:MAG: methanogenesis marker protein Mmp4/MtxX [Methanoregula sp.]|nr:methanogenesis marker protein Mmp4/MtxX [Methanoregula sp.]